jgi:hypothetical protein
MKLNNKALAITALTSLLVGTTAFAADPKPAADETAMCYGVNGCKGQGACSGKVDSCNGKNGCNTEVTCAGHNACKGKGLVKLSKKDCMAKKGTVASK